MPKKYKILIDTPDYENFVNKCNDSSVQILKIKDHKLEALGSGILFKNNRRYYLITAGHNFEGELLFDFRLLLSTKVVQIEGEINYGIDLRFFDYGIVELSSRLGEVIAKEKRFLNENNLEINHHQGVNGKFNSRIENNYLIGGYPASQTKYWESSNTLKNKFVSFTGSCVETPYMKFIREGFVSHLFIDGRTHVLDENGRKIKLSKLNGMSGCGIWRSRGGKENSLSENVLVGIFQQVKDESLIFLKLDIFVQVLIDVFEDVNLPNPGLKLVY